MVNCAEDRGNESLSEFDVKKVSEVKGQRLISKSKGRIFRMQVVERVPNGEYYLGVCHVQGSELETALRVILSWQSECGSPNDMSHRCIKIIGIDSY